MILPTYSLVKVKDIKNDVYILENGGLRGILSVSGIDFALLSEKEQNLAISQFKNFLDGLDFPVEVLITSRFENINDYLKILHLRLEEEKDFLIKFQIEGYIRFLEGYLDTYKVMKKIFFVIVPYDTVEVNLKGILTKKTEKTDESLDIKIQQLNSRIDYIETNLSNMGLSVERLKFKELVELLFEFYNPNPRWKQIPKGIIESLTELT